MRWRGALCTPSGHHGTEAQVPPERRKDVPPGTIYRREGWEATSLPSLRGLVKYLMAQTFL